MEKPYKKKIKVGGHEYEVFIEYAGCDQDRKTLSFNAWLNGKGIKIESFVQRKENIIVYEDDFNKDPVFQDHREELNNAIGFVTDKFLTLCTILQMALEKRNLQFIHEYEKNNTRDESIVLALNRLVGEYLRENGDENLFDLIAA